MKIWAGILLEESMKWVKIISTSIKIEYLYIFYLENRIDDIEKSVSDLMNDLGVDDVDLHMKKWKRKIISMFLFFGIMIIELCILNYI